MRISDWSSDVCSSDLAEALVPGGGRQRGPTAQDGQLLPAEGGHLANHRPRLTERRQQRLDQGADGGDADSVCSCGVLERDRKSVVSGQSVSVRVDLGGRRIIKKKKQNKNIDTN